MEYKNHHKQNTEVILNSIISANKKMQERITDFFPKLTKTQLYTVLLLKLDYSSKEISILLGISDISINEIIELLDNSQLISACKKTPHFSGL